MGGRLNDMRSYETAGGTFAQAAFRWVLSNPDVDALIVSMTSTEQIDEFLAASGSSKVAANDVHLLTKYAALNGTSQCRQGCGDCSDSCPLGVPIEDVLRARMYANDYEQLELARASYALLGAGASPCLSCSGQPCATACTWGLDIPGLTRSTPDILGLG
jgi:predicted aldo/keto reductase-like oxidoreductase